ncbi:PLC-like phosphodiesterases superfamily protein [Hibiscus syriacus]|uniref:Ninja-family protein n=1 Tax=Hibiscus syriacus TaxID=106335 RepID=A0A6A3BU27_HIBSY|nr:ninja-family protein AFP3-like [Hibiscus syriacus]KAE8719401.1 PLC-like phosphodiesterases superfamily protein [Hibiscus syriacus]
MFPSKTGSQASENTSSSISSSSSKEMNLSLQTENYPRNLLQRFTPSETQASTRSEEEQVELNLGLSLGGRFGVDKHANKLKRSSSIAGSIPIFREIDDADTTPPSVPRPTLVRASSLPTETEEERRKRKELQTLRRMEAKRRRCEKQRSSREENKALQGARSSGEARSSGCSLSSEDQGNREATGSWGTETGEFGRTPSLLCETLHKTNENKGKERGHAMEDMPCVFTKGEGPNGKRVDGILYRYGKGEEVRIMCVCHGSFLSPVEFVKHADGGNVDHPLRHIVINPSFASLS